MRLKHIALTASLLTPLAFVAPGASADQKHKSDRNQSNRILDIL